MEPDDEDTPMVVTECPECDGIGYAQGSGEREVTCSNPNAFWNEIGEHVVPVETLDDGLGDPFPEDDEPDVPVESGPEAGGMAPVAGDDLPSGVHAIFIDEIDWPDDPIGVVTVGDNNGLAHIVTRALGGGEGPFTAGMAELVNQYREDCGLDDYPEDVVVGKLWAMVLPPVKVGDRGQVARWLCRALELPVKNVVDLELMTEAILRANPGYLASASDMDEAELRVASYEWDAMDWASIL
jgi:hypothetical protein